MVALKEPPWDVGDEVVLFVQLVDATGAPANPNELILQVGNRKGAVLHTYKKSLNELTNPAVGTWEKHYVIDQPDLRFSWDAVGVVTIAAEGPIETRARKLARPA